MAATLVATPAAPAATLPAAATGRGANVAQTTATLTGSVNPHGTATTYVFQYGTTTAYGAQTPPTAAGSGTRSVAVTASVVDLSPATTYHFRIVATSAAGTRNGVDHTFTTRKQPLGFTFAATPNPVPFGGATTLAGALTGTGGAGRQIVLQQKAYPFTAGFRNVGNPLVTGADGAFSFPIVGLASTTQFRVVTSGAPRVVSPIATVGAAVVVRVHVGTHTVHRGHMLRFAGSVAPNQDGAQYAVQKQRGPRWVTVAGGGLHHLSTTTSRYAKRVRISRGGTYRIYVKPNSGAFVPGVSAPERIHTR